MTRSNRIIGNGWLARSLRVLARLRQEQSGNAVLEIGMVVAIFVPPLLVGTAETATVIYASIEVANAAHAAALYGMQSSTFAASTSGMQTAGQAEAADFGTALTVTPTVYYACSSALAGTTYTTQSLATTACTGSGNHALEFVKVVASISVTPTFHFVGIAKTYALTSTSVMGVEE
jgi:Flp pilus assembly protein TadG